MELGSQRAIQRSSGVLATRVTVPVLPLKLAASGGLESRVQGYLLCASISQVSAEARPFC